MSSNQIISVSNESTSSGTNGKPNGIVQLQQPQNTGAWVLCDNGTTYINGQVNFQNQPTYIEANDGSCYVDCVNGGNLDLDSQLNMNISVLNGTITTNCQTQNTTASGDVTVNASTINVNPTNGIYFSMPADFQVTSNNVYLNVGSNMLINNNPSSQENICYGQAKWGTDTATEQYHIQYADPDIPQPTFNLRMFGTSDFNQWFDDDFYNRPDNNIIIKDGDGFRWTNVDSKMIEISWNFQLYYTFDGQNPECFLCTGLFDVDNSVIVPQSLTWFQQNGVKHKYLSFTTIFTMRKNQSSKYFPFFMQHTNNQVQFYDFGGNSRSWIKFKEMQFITY